MKNSKKVDDITADGDAALAKLKAAVGMGTERVPSTNPQLDLEIRLRTAESLIEDLMGFVNVGGVRAYWQKQGEMAGCSAVINRANRFMAEGRKRDG